ncbi:MAG: hypothetical protein U0X39_05440 [Bacteroidales bacterium]
MNSKVLFPVILFLISLKVSGQSNPVISKRDFRTDNPGFDAAWKHLDAGDELYRSGGLYYSKALEHYKISLLYNPGNAELNYKSGIAALMSDRKEEAANYLAKAYKIKNNVTGDVLLYWGLSLGYQSKFSRADSVLNLYLASDVRKSRAEIKKAERCIVESKAGIQLLNDPVNALIRNAGIAINSPSDDYSPVLSSDGLLIYYASRRPTEISQKSRYKDAKFDENIYYSKWIDTAWSVGVNAGKNINTEFNESPLFMDLPGEHLYIYAGYEGAGDILVSELRRGGWKVPVAEDFGINSKGAETSICISPDGTEIAYVSDRGKGSMGGSDIYFIEKKGKRRWTRPVNAGDGINSEYNEESVRYSKGGDTLWFSSTGHNSIGGYDIFFSVRNKSGEWEKCRNAGIPVNSAWNDWFFLQSTKDNDLYYFVSDRAGGLGGMDIYTCKIPAGIDTKPPIDKTPAIPVKLEEDTGK